MKKITLVALVTFLSALANFNSIQAQTTQLQTAFCSYTATSYSEFISCDTIPPAGVYYEFTLENVSNGYLETFTNEGNGPDMALYLFPNLVPNTAYTVTVRWSGDAGSTWSLPGSACEVTTPAAIITQLSSGFCNTTIPAYTTLMTVDEVSGAQQYRFTIYNAALNYTQAVTKTFPDINNNFNLTMFPGLAASTQYTVFAEVNLLGAFDIPGPECVITTPGAYTTQMESGSCGITPSSYYDLLFAESVDGVTDYEFMLSDGMGFTTTFAKTNSNFNLSQFAGLTDGTTYDVSVRVSTDGGITYGPYGVSCPVTTPVAATTQLATGYCGTTPGDYNQLIFADEVVGATAYEYHFYNDVISYNQSQFKNSNTNLQSNANFNLLMFSGLTAGTTYTVEVSVQFNGVFGPYGSPCTISVPSDPTTQLQSGDCGATATSYTNQLFRADIIEGATQYEFLFTNAGLSYSVPLIKGNNNFILDQFAGLANSTTYTVEVRVNFNGSWGLFGTPCTITTPGSYVKTSNPLLAQANELETPAGSSLAKLSISEPGFGAIVFPNPYEQDFTLQVSGDHSKHPVLVRVIDISGKELERRSINASESANIKIGAEYAPGIYNVVVSQNSSVKTMRVVKR